MPVTRTNVKKRTGLQIPTGGKKRSEYMRQYGDNHISGISKTILDPDKYTRIGRVENCEALVEFIGPGEVGEVIKHATGTLLIVVRNGVLFIEYPETTDPMNRFKKANPSQTARMSPNTAYRLSAGPDGVEILRVQTVNYLENVNIVDLPDTAVSVSDVAETNAVAIHRRSYSKEYREQIAANHGKVIHRDKIGDMMAAKAEPGAVGNKQATVSMASAMAEEQAEMAKAMAFVKQQQSQLPSPE